MSSVSEGVKELVGKLAKEYKCSKSYVYIMLAELKNVQSIINHLKTEKHEYTHNGETYKTICDVSKKVGKSQTNIKNRLLKGEKLSYIIDMYMEKDSNSSETKGFKEELERLGYHKLTDYCKDNGISRQRLYYIINNKGLCLEKAMEYCVNQRDIVELTVQNVRFRSREHLANSLGVCSNVFWRRSSEGETYKEIVENILDGQPLEERLEEVGYFELNK